MRIQDVSLNSYNENNLTILTMYGKKDCVAKGTEYDPGVGLIHIDFKEKKCSFNYL